MLLINHRNLGEKRLFLIFGIFNFLLTNITLQIALFLIPTLAATCLSQIINFFLGINLYGKKVFKLNYLNKSIFKKYLFLTICLWFLNYGLIQFLYKYGFNKNISAILIIPLLVTTSYLFQKYFVFK